MHVPFSHFFCHLKFIHSYLEHIAQFRIYLLFIHVPFQLSPKIPQKGTIYQGKHKQLKESSSNQQQSNVDFSSCRLDDQQRTDQSLPDAKTNRTRGEMGSKYNNTFKLIRTGNLPQDSALWRAPRLENVQLRTAYKSLVDRYSVIQVNKPSNNNNKRGFPRIGS